MIELLSNSEMAEADRLAIASGISGASLMANAGRAVADAVAARHPLGTRIVVVAGPGNNGGDGFVVARRLSERGYPVRVLFLGERDRLKGDAADAAKAWTGTTERASADSLLGAQVIVDALFGAGLDRAVEGEARALIEAINAHTASVIAVDLPSGINGSSGAVMAAAVTAAETVTFFRRKPGHVLLPGRQKCGRVTVADIGIPASVLAAIKPHTFVNAPALWRDRFPLPRLEGHKYSRGHALVLSGGLSSTGAARLAARAALRAGAGLVTLATPREALVVNAVASLSVMVRPCDGVAEFSGLLADRRINAVVVGPGGGTGPQMAELVLAALAGDRAAVLDADALTSFVDDPNRLFTALRRHDESFAVLTPHDGEFSCLFNGKEQKDAVKQKLKETLAASHEAGAVVVRKGADTVIAAPDGRAAISENAPPWLATAGSGDVLAGLIGGLRAQGMPAFEAACAGVWLHGECGSEAGPGLIADDLPECLPPVYRRLFQDIAEARA
jgi:ADP-dependent NAD(P)H-hydrate dehydratase / NAD(P)H-hydrate epimerase